MINLTTKIAIKIGKWYIKNARPLFGSCQTLSPQAKFLENEGGKVLAFPLLYYIYIL